MTFKHSRQIKLQPECQKTFSSKQMLLKHMKRYEDTKYPKNEDNVASTGMKHLGDQSRWDAGDAGDTRPWGSRSAMTDMLNQFHTPLENSPLYHFDLFFKKGNIASVHMCKSCICYEYK